MSPQQHSRELCLSKNPFTRPLPLEPGVHDDTAGRVLARLSACGPMRLFTAGAVRAATRLGWERRYGHFDTTSRSVWGAYQYAETQALPLQVP